MRNEFTAIIEQDGPWYVAYCPEVPGANGQGKSREECLANLREAIAPILDTAGRRPSAHCRWRQVRNSWSSDEARRAATAPPSAWMRNSAGR